MGGQKQHNGRQLGVSKKSEPWTSTFVMKVLQENGRRSHVTFLVHTFWTQPTGCLSFTSATRRESAGSLGPRATDEPASYSEKDVLHMGTTSRYQQRRRRSTTTTMTHKNNEVKANGGRRHHHRRRRRRRRGRRLRGFRHLRRGSQQRSSQRTMAMYVRLACDLG